jgi:cytochrome c-type biogenesis protein CcmF
VAGVGRACLLLGLALAASGIGASLYGVRTHRPEWVEVGRRCVYALAGVMTVAFVVLEAAFWRTDLSFDVVASHSSTTTPLFYRVAAPWSSQEGSLLLWVWLLSLWSSLALRITRKRLVDVAPYATAVLLGFAAFFLSMSAFLVNPFGVTTPAPAEGVGLQPLLRHPSMMIHPPMLYSGYTLFAVPFAFAIGALIAGKVDAEWIRSTRRFALMAWLCLGVGILIGARWSWTELGWGGFWAWDPVENAALMPWLTGTAFLHSVMIQEKRGMLRVWNVSLVLATGVLAVLGTFLVRSGVLQSIHAFGGSTLGRPFLAFIALILVGSVALVVLRLPSLRSRARLDSLLSREAIFLLNNLVLTGICFVIFWGTFFPLISEAVTGKKASVGPPWFDRYTVPLAIALVLLSGIGPVVAWRRATLSNARRNLARPAAFSLLMTIALAVGVNAGRDLATLALFAAASFAVAAVTQEFWRGARARRASAQGPLAGALLGVVRRNRRRYGGYIVHVGVAVIFTGVAASSAFQQVRDVRLSPGQTARVGAYDVRYVRPTSRMQAEKISLGAVLDVTKDGRHVTTLRPTRGYYPTPDPNLGPVGRYFDGEATSEVGLSAGPTRDIWTAVQPDLGHFQRAIAQADQRFADASPATQGLLLSAIAARYQAAPPPATFRMIVSPLVEWVWLGGGIAALGGLLALWPSRVARRSRRASAVVAVRLRRVPEGA